MREFGGRTAVVTGAAAGIGRGLAERLAREGMRVVLADVEQAATNRSLRIRVWYGTGARRRN
ncbi:MAG: SDR family NAD(P)-dependent oxidoreductase [Spirochaetaceae bacterium]|nr:SDR family NAD(P)-dependent oxidoreductase [Spirochaetaceae bacterium]